MSMHKWVDQAACLGKDTEMFFSLYENFGVPFILNESGSIVLDPDIETDPEYRKDVDGFCQLCPVQPQCLATGVSRKESGVWGGVYLDNGKISREFNSHKDKQDWFAVWQAAAMESK